MERRLKIGVITASVREVRQGEKVARWFLEFAATRPELELVPIDLRDWPLPYYKYPRPPRMIEHSYPTELEQNWIRTLTPLDGFVIVTPEYNHGYPAALKNALDYAYTPWNGKPVGFVSYGGVSGGIRSVEQLRLVAVELHLVPVREEVNIPFVFRALDEQGKPLDPLPATRAAGLLDQLSWYARALAEAREKSPYPGLAPSK